MADLDDPLSTMAPAKSVDESFAALALAEAGQDNVLQVDAGKSKASGKTFPFFDLPRELRDQVYDKSFQRIEHLPSEIIDPVEEMVQTSVLHGVRKNLLLVSHQFQEEYLEQAKERTIVVVTNNRAHFAVIQTPLTPSLAAYVQKLELQLVVHCQVSCHVRLYPRPPCCNVSNELSLHGAWIREMICQLRLPVLSLSVALLLRTHRLVSECKDHLLQHHGEISDICELTDLKVYRCPDNCPDNVGCSRITWDYATDKVLMMEYDPQSGKLLEIGS